MHTSNESNRLDIVLNPLDDDLKTSLRPRNIGLLSVSNRTIPLDGNTRFSYISPTVLHIC
jgi:hypothetical protein